jgi:hypothetical protein
MRFEVSPTLRDNIKIDLFRSISIVIKDIDISISEIDIKSLVRTIAENGMILMIEFEINGLSPGFEFSSLIIFVNTK